METKIGSRCIGCLYFNQEMKEKEERRKKICMTSDNQGIHKSIICPVSGQEQRNAQWSVMCYMQDF